MTAAMAYKNHHTRVPSDWKSVLLSILDRAQELGARGVLAFDLDSTLFDNRPRQALILREFGQAQNIAALAGCTAAHFTRGWDLRAALLACGLTPEEVQAVIDPLRRFWRERFFTSEYCVHDQVIEGAAEFMARAAATGAKIAYITGRDEAMRKGTVEAMRMCGLPLPGEGIHLLMKPHRLLDDDGFKREAHEALGKLGELIAAFDNEPAHANDYLRRFPEAEVIHLATDHSGRPVDILDGIVSVPHFRLE